MTEHDENFDDFFEGGVRGAPSFDFDSPGDAVRGVITKMRKSQQREFRKDGSQGDLLWFDKEKTQPREQIEVTLQTTLRNWDKCARVPTKGKDDPTPLDASEDTGERRLFVKYKLKEAISEAIRAVPDCPGPRIGGELAVRYLRDETVPGGDAKVYEARYAPPPPIADSSWGTDAPPAAPAAPTPPAPPAAPAAPPPPAPPAPAAPPPPAPAAPPPPPAAPTMPPEYAAAGWTPEQYAAHMAQQAPPTPPAPAGDPWSGAQPAPGGAAPWS